MEAKEVKAIRAELGLSQEQFAKLLGVSWMTVWRWEHGAKMSPLAKRRLEDVKNVSGGSKGKE